MNLHHVLMNVIPCNVKYVSGGNRNINPHAQKHDIIEISVVS